MSVTNYNQPEDYTPASNAQIFTSLSNQTATVNFKYKVKCTDSITSTQATYEIDDRPDNRLAFDASEFSKQYVKHYVPNNVYGWQVCTNGVRNIVVNVGETYGTTPAYASGVNFDFHVWNAGLPWIEFNGYDKNEYLYDSSTGNFVYLSSRPAETGYEIIRGKTFEDRSLFLYVLANTQNSFESLKIISYDSNNNILGTSYIANPYWNDASYRNKYFCIDIGKKGLDNIASGLVTGTFPILPVNCAWYELYDNTTVVSPPSVTDIKVRRIDIEDECRYDVYTLHYIDKEGNGETLNFAKVSETNIQAEKTYYRRNPWEMSGNDYNYSLNTAQEVVLNSHTTTRIRINTDWMTEEECNSHKYLISSPLVYLDLGSNIDLIPVKVVSNSWRVNKKWNDRVYNITLDIEYTFKDVYQNG